VAEAGGVIAGGHTLIDAEPKYGLCVTGVVRPDAILRKAGAQPGDVLLLTKPLGTGIILTAAREDACAPEHLQAAVDSMLRLNRHPSHLAREAGVHACTDVTGFGLLGHAEEMARAGGVRLVIELALSGAEGAARVPDLPGALEYARQGHVTGGAQRNREGLAGKVSLPKGLPDVLGHLLFDPQTSGGLLFALPPNGARDLEAEFAAAGLPLWRVGEIVEGRGVEVLA